MYDLRSERKVDSEFGGDFSPLLNTANLSMLGTDFVLSDFLVLSFSL